MTDRLLPHAPRQAPPGGLGIGQASEACGVSVDTLRYYEKKMLLLAPTARDSGGRRRYTSADLAWIAGLIMLRETGMTISQMRDMAELYRTPGTDLERLELLTQHRDRVFAEQRRIAAHMRAIEEKITSYQSALQRLR